MRPSNILPLASPNSSRTDAGRGYSSPLRVARMATSPRNDIAPRPPSSMNSSSSSSVGSEYTTPRRNDPSTGYGATSGSGGNILPVLASPAHAQVQPLRTPSPNAFKRSVWTTPRSPCEPRESAGGNISGLQTPPRRNSRSFDDDDQFGLGENEYPYYSDESTTESYLFNAEPTDPVTSFPVKPKGRGDLEKPKFNDEAQLEQLAYMEQMYNTIQISNAELEKERQDRAHLMPSRIEDEVTAALECPSHGGLLQFTASEFDDPSMNLITASTPSSAAGSRKSRPIPQPTRPSPPQSSKTLSKDQVELCATLGKNAELRIRTKEMEKNAEKTSAQLDQAQEQMKLVERRISNREEKLRILLKEKLHWQKELKGMRDQVVEEKMRQVELFRRLETGKRENAAQIEQMERDLRDIYDENQILRAQAAEAKAHITFQAKKMDELAWQARDEKEKLVSCIAEARYKFKEWKEGEAAALKNSRDQAVNNVKTEYDLKIARHQEEKHKLREEVKDLEVSLRLMQKDRMLSPLELSLRKATILGSKENAGTTEAELIEAHSRIRELESLLDHSQEYQKRQENIIKVSEATISQLVQEREVTALENLSLQPLAGGFVNSSNASDVNAFPSSILNYPVSPSPYAGSHREPLKKQSPVKNTSHEVPHVRSIASGSRIQPASSSPLLHTHFRSASASEVLPPPSSSAFSLMASSPSKLNHSLADGDRQPSLERGDAPRRQDTGIHAGSKSRPELTPPAPISEEDADAEQVKEEANPGSLEAKDTLEAKETPMSPAISSNEQFLASEVERLQKELAVLKANGFGNKDISSSAEEARGVGKSADSNPAHTNNDILSEKNRISEEMEEKIADGDEFDPVGDSIGEQKKTPIGEFEDSNCSQTADLLKEFSPDTRVNDDDRNDAANGENILKTLDEDDSDVKIEAPAKHFDDLSDSGSVAAAEAVIEYEGRQDECVSDMPSSETAADKIVKDVEEKVSLQDLEIHAEVGENVEVSTPKSGEDDVNLSERTGDPCYAIEEVNHVIFAVAGSLSDIEGSDVVAGLVACTIVGDLEDAASEGNERTELDQIAYSSEPQNDDAAQEASTGGDHSEEKDFVSEQISGLETNSESCEPGSSSDADGNERQVMELEAEVPDATLALEIGDGGQEAEAELALDDFSATLRDEKSGVIVILATPAEDKQFLTDNAERCEPASSFGTVKNEQQSMATQAKTFDEAFEHDFEGKSQRAEEKNAPGEEGQDFKGDDSDTPCVILCDEEKGAVSTFQSGYEEHLVGSAELSQETPQPLDAKTADVLAQKQFQEISNNYPADDLDGDALNFRSGHGDDDSNDHKDVILDDVTIATAETSLDAEEPVGLEIDGVESDIMTLDDSCAVLASAYGSDDATEDERIENLCLGSRDEGEQMKLDETALTNRSMDAEVSEDQSEGSTLITATAEADSDGRLQGGECSGSFEAAMHDPRLENPIFEENTTRKDFDGFVDVESVRIQDAEQKDADEASQKGVDETGTEQCDTTFYSNAVESAALRSVVAQLTLERAPDALVEPEQPSSPEILPAVELEAFENRQVDTLSQEDDTACGTHIAGSFDSQPTCGSAPDEDTSTQSDANECDSDSDTTENATMLPNDGATSSSDPSLLAPNDNEQLCVAAGEESCERSECQQRSGSQDPEQGSFNKEADAGVVATNADDDVGLATGQILQPVIPGIVSSVASEERLDVNEPAICAEVEVNLSDTARKSLVEAFILEVQDEAISLIVANRQVLHFVKKDASASDELPASNSERPEAESDLSSNTKEDNYSSLPHAHETPGSSQSETLDPDNFESNDVSAANEERTVFSGDPNITTEGFAALPPEFIDEEPSSVEDAVANASENVVDTTRPNVSEFNAVEFVNVIESKAIAAITKSATSTLGVMESETTIEAEAVSASQSTHECVQSESSALVIEDTSPSTEYTHSVTKTPKMNSSDHASALQGDEAMAADCASEFATTAHPTDSVMVTDKEKAHQCSSPAVLSERDTGENENCATDARVVLNLELPDPGATEALDIAPSETGKAGEGSVAITEVNAPTDAVEETGENKVPAKVTWVLPECENDKPPAPKQPTKAEKRRVSRRLLLDQSRFASVEMMRDPTLAAYDAHHEQGQPFALLDDSILSIDPNARHLQHDENDQAKYTETEILAKRKNFDQENHRKSIAYRSTPAFNCMSVLIRFQRSDFVVAIPISLSSDPADKKTWSPVKKMRLLVKKGTKLPCGTYAIISAFIRPLGDGNENLRIHIYDSEWVEEFQYDFLKST
ncbi:hypothetical protein FI667_g5583, partial [Globisporangium splendens]